jgi:hypothetical protein
LFENRVLRRIYGTTREEVIGRQIMLLVVEFCIFNPATNQRGLNALECGAQLKDSKFMHSFIQITLRKG